MEKKQDPAVYLFEKDGRNTAENEKKQNPAVYLFGKDGRNTAENRKKQHFGADEI